MTKKAWGGRFSKSTDKLTEDFTASVHFDKRLYAYDIEGSIAHCMMLGKCKIIKNAEAKIIISGLKKIKEEIDSKNFKFNKSLEDIHMNIEKRLIEIVGPVGGKLHTARSRNDQVATDIRLYLKAEINFILKDITILKTVLVTLANNNTDIVMPGYTHLQRAQPVFFSHHMLAYYEMFKRDGERFLDVLKRTDIMPLGSAALAGTNFPIDRKITKEKLSFSDITRNSIDSVSDRDFAIEFISASSILMMHLSRMCEELIIWSSAEFKFIDMDDAFCTGSSIMPQKKNPDICEIVRGKTGRVYGNLMAILTIMKSLPLAYNRDMQEDKEPVFDTVDTISACLKIMPKLLKNIKINKSKLAKIINKDFMTATDIADYLVMKDIPFRDAHEIVGNIVGYCTKSNKELNELTLDELKNFSKLIDKDIFDFIVAENSANNKTSYGGTAKSEVLKRIKEINGS